MAYTPTNFRIPPVLKRRLQAQATRNCRSLSGELVYLLEQHLEPAEAPAPARVEVTE
jgi:predicted DNA-binding protein